MNFIPKITAWDLIDIFIVAFVLYKVFLFLSRTRAFQILIGLLFLLIVSVFAKFFHLYTVSFIFNNFATIGIFALIVVFQPEIRKILARIGERQFGIFSSKEEAEHVIDETIKAVSYMSSNRIGALIVVEREVNVDNYIEAGTVLDAEISNELLTTIFWPGTPLHDGASIIRFDKVYKSGAFLPLTLNPNIPQTLGARHRAAVGITEETDAIAIVVSEETGYISLAYSGKLIRELDIQRLKVMLNRFMVKRVRFKSFMDMLKETLEENIGKHS